MPTPRILHPTLRAIRNHPTKYALWGFFWGTTIPIFIEDTFYDISKIEGSSMAPTLSPTYHATGACDLVLFSKWKPLEDLRRGDVVQYMNPSKPDAFAVKRVIGLEGDTVILDPRRRPPEVLPDGTPEREAQGWDAWGGKARVPQGHVWVEGDNVGRSRDSNYVGPISRSLIEGRAKRVVSWRDGRFWTRPWEGYRSRTKVVKGGDAGDWTRGLPVGFGEVGGTRAPP